MSIKTAQLKVELFNSHTTHSLGSSTGLCSHDSAKMKKKKAQWKTNEVIISSSWLLRAILSL